MKKMFLDHQGKFSSGRVMALVLFFSVTGVWFYIKATKAEMTAYDADLIKWGWGIAILGKAFMGLGEKK